MIYEWLISNYQWLISILTQIAVAVGTIILAYMSYRQIQNSNVKIHISDLKILIRQWQQSLKEVAEAEEPGSITYFWAYKPDLKYIEIENQTLFEDIFYHFPNIKDDWTNFKELEISYSEKRQALFNQIEGYIEQKIKERDFNLDKKGFSLTVYRETICIAKGKDQEFEYYDTSSFNPEKRYLSYYYKGQGGGGYHLAEIEAKRIDEVKNIHKELIKECEEQYLDKIKELIQTESKVKESMTKLESMFSEITFRTVFPKMNCIYVKAPY